MDDIIKQCLMIIVGIPVGLFCLYAVCRVASFAIFKSFSEAFNKGGSYGKKESTKQ